MAFLPRAKVGAEAWRSARVGRPNTTLSVRVPPTAARPARRSTSRNSTILLDHPFLDDLAVNMAGFLTRPPLASVDGTGAGRHQMQQSMTAARPNCKMPGRSAATGNVRFMSAQADRSSEDEWRMAKNNRDEFPLNVKKALADRAGNRCSFPGCGAPTMGPSDEAPNASSNVGMACHIVAAASGPGAPSEAKHVQ